MLGLSLAANVWLFNSRDSALEDLASQKLVSTSYQAAAGTCSESVDKLAAFGKGQGKAILDKLDTEATRIKSLQQDAITAARAKPDDPKDLCGSIERYLKSQIREEHKK